MCTFTAVRVVGSACYFGCHAGLEVFDLFRLYVWLEVRPFWAL